MSAVPIPNMSNQQSAKSGASNNSSQGISSGGISAPLIINTGDSGAATQALISEVGAFNSSLNVASNLAGGTAISSPQLTASTSLASKTSIWITLGVAGIGGFVVIAFLMSTKGRK